jgi:hypothetical protein
LASVADIPVDNRSKEVSSALAVAAVAAGCTLTDVMHADDITLYANTLLSAMLALGVVDNFYDLIKSGSTLAAKQMNNNKSAGGSSDSPSFQLPEKESLPLGLGTGQVSGSVVRGQTCLRSMPNENVLRSGGVVARVHAPDYPALAFDQRSSPSGGRVDK